jgi:hypothetical protein
MFFLRKMIEFSKIYIVSARFYIFFYLQILYIDLYREESGRGFKVKAG